jgi:hypothetical protein
MSIGGYSFDLLSMLAFLVVVVVVLGLRARKQSTTKDDDENDYGKTRKSPPRRNLSYV